MSPCEELLPPLLLVIPSVMMRVDIATPLNPVFSTATSFFSRQFFQMLLTRLSLTAGSMTLLPSSSLQGLLSVSLEEISCSLRAISMVLFLQWRKIRFFCSCSCLLVARTSSTLNGPCFSLYFWKASTRALMYCSSKAISGSNCPLVLKRFALPLEGGRFSFSAPFTLILLPSFIIKLYCRIKRSHIPALFSKGMQLNSQSFGEPRIEDSILFDVNEQTLLDMNLTEHISRLQQMSRFLGDALNKNRSNLVELREMVKSQIANLKNNTQILQSNIRDETAQLKGLFEPAVAAEVKKINELKTDVGKINAEQLTTKKYLLNLEAAISHCETEIGFREYKR